MNLRQITAFRPGEHSAARVRGRRPGLARGTLLAVALAALLATASGAQQTIHVPADQPTIQSAIDAATNGDTVLVAPGTYNENLNFEGKAISVTTGATKFSDPAVQSTIINGTLDGPVVNISSGEPSSAVLNGFTIQNGHASANSRLNVGGILVSGASPTLTNNLVTDNYGCGILVVNSAGPLIQGNDVKGNSAGSSDSFCRLSTTAAANAGTGIAMVDAGDVRIVGNIIEDNVLANNPSNQNCFGGVSIRNGSEVLLEDNIVRNNRANCHPGIGETIGNPAGKLLLIQNLIYGNTDPNGYETLQIFLSGTADPPYPSLKEINNTIDGLGQEFVLSFAPSAVENNIIMNTNADPNAYIQEYALWCADPEAQNSPLAIRNNDIYPVGQVQSSGCALGTGNLAVDPLFRNPTNNNFRVQPSSPVVGVGDFDAPEIPPVDLDGKARTVNGTIDMGVYEVRPRPPITLAVAPTTAPGGSIITFTATVSLSEVVNGSSPTGQVSFFDGKTLLGTGTLSSEGVAVFSADTLPVGTHTVTARYDGNFDFDWSTSNAVTVNITGYPTSIVLSANPLTAQAGQPITLMVNVSSRGGTPSGTVTFFADGATLGNDSLSGGAASLPVTDLAVGSHIITASYVGSTQFAEGSSNPLTVMVIPVATTTALTATPNPATPGQTVTLTASVTDEQTGYSPAGTVTFLDGSTVLGTAALSANHTATLTTSSLSVGTHSLTASWVSTSSLGASVSPTVIEVIEPPAGDFSLAVVGSPTQTITAGQSATWRFHLNPLNGYYPGAVTFSVAGLPINAAFSISPSALTSQQGAQTVTLRVDTAGSAAAASRELSRPVLASIALLILPFAGAFRRARRTRLLAVLVIASCILLGTSSCGTTVIPGYTATYNLTFTAVSGSDQHRAAIALIEEVPKPPQ